MERSQILKSKKALINNISNICTTLTSGALLMSVLKGDAYGHGIKETVEIIDRLTDWYAVATFDEAIEIRKKSEKPILILGRVEDNNLSETYTKNIHLNLFSEEYGAHLNDWSLNNNKQLNVHIEIDTGFNRTGFKYKPQDENLIEDLIEVYKYKNIFVTGIFTHFIFGSKESPEAIDITQYQYDAFIKTTSLLKSLGYETGLEHIANGKATMCYPEYHMDMVRVGAYIFGLTSFENQNNYGIEPVLSWNSTIIQIKELQKGDGVSYGSLYKAEDIEKIAIVQTGFADGFPRVYSDKNENYVLVDGVKCRIIGRICMDYFMISVNNMEVTVGDTVTLVGTSKKENISADYIARLIGSTAGEITTGITNRVNKKWID